MSRLTAMSPLNVSPLDDTHYIQFWTLIYSALKCRQNRDPWWATGVGQAYLPSSPPTEQTCVGFRYLVILFVEPQLWSLWPRHHWGKLTPQRQDTWTLQVHGSRSADFLPYVHPNLIMLTCSNLYPLASPWVFSNWINRINGVSGKPDFSLWAFVSLDLWESLPANVLGGQNYIKLVSTTPRVMKRSKQGGEPQGLQGTSDSLLIWEVRVRITQEWNLSFNFRQWMGTFSFSCLQSYLFFNKSIKIYFQEIQSSLRLTFCTVNHIN